MTPWETLVLSFATVLFYQVLKYFFNELFPRNCKKGLHKIKCDCGKHWVEVKERAEDQETDFYFNGNRDLMFTLRDVPLVYAIELKEQPKPEKYGLTYDKGVCLVHCDKKEASN